MKVLVTGGAGFIGSHVVEALLGRGDDVLILDDLSTGDISRVPPGVQFIEGSILDSAALAQAGKVETVVHLAALRAVPRSVDNPLDSDRVNTHGTLNVLDWARRSGVGRVVSASSSSVYGGADTFPTVEAEKIRPRSPYAVSKVAGEMYSSVFSELYGLETVSLRYFNVYGPRQDPRSQYAACVPLFAAAILSGNEVEIHGDGKQSRDFTFARDAAAATVLATSAQLQERHLALNVASGYPVDLLGIVAHLERIIGRSASLRHQDPRPGDVRHTHADVTLASTTIGYKPATELADGLNETVAWLRAAS